jgi:predicted dehydrogenase
MSKKLRWGILGTGNIAGQFVAGLNTSQRGVSQAVGSRSAESAAKFAKDFHVSRGYGTYQQLIDDPEVDVVYNGLPNNLHAKWSIAAMRAGKHVLCEKPIALNAGEAREMFDVAKSTGKILVEAFMYRSHPQTLAVVDAVRAGAIGELRLIRTSFCFRARKTAGNVRFNREIGGGGLMDIGCYCVNFSRFFAGAEPTAVHVIAHTHPTGVDDVAAGTLLFPGGLIAGFTCGLSVQADNTAYLCGDEGFIEIPMPWKPAARSQFVITRGTPPRMDDAKAANTPPPRDVRWVDCAHELYAMEADDFAATVEGKPPRISEADSIGNMVVLDELRRQIGLEF